MDNEWEENGLVMEDWDFPDDDVFDTMDDEQVDNYYSDEEESEDSNDDEENDDSHSVIEEEMCGRWRCPGLQFTPAQWDAHNLAGIHTGNANGFDDEPMEDSSDDEHMDDSDDDDDSDDCNADDGSDDYSDDEDGDDSDEEDVVYLCKHCPGQEFTAADKDAHKLMHRNIRNAMRNQQP